MKNNYSFCKKILWVGAVGAVAATGLSGQALAGSYNIRMAHYFPVDSYIHEEMMSFADRVKEKTNGEVEVEVHGAGVLGGDRELSEQVRMGAIQMANLGVTTQAPLDKNFSIGELPYLWTDYDQIVEAYNEGLGEYFTNLMLEHGARPLGFFPFGYRHTTNNVRPISEPSDFAGVKMRISEIPIRLDAFKEIGAQPVPISFPELYTALQQGTVDGQENPLFLIETSQFHEVQDYLSLTRHIVNMNQIIINEDFYKSLPKEYQEDLREEVQLSSEKMASETQAVEDAALQRLIEKGMKVNDNVDLEKMREALLPVYEKWEKEFDPELWALIEEYSSL